MQISSIKKINEPCFVSVRIEGKKVNMEVDSGSAVSVIDEHTFGDKFNYLPLLPYQKSLVVVDDAKLQVLVVVHVAVAVNDKRVDK